MSLTVLENSVSDSISNDVPPAKEANSLPLPSTTPANQLGHGSVSQKLVWLLQYLNPLFYARLAQSFVSSVLESYGGSENNCNGRITEHPHSHISVPIPADATAIECGYAANLHHPQLAGLPQLDLESTQMPVQPDSNGMVDNEPETMPQTPQPPGIAQSEYSAPLCQPAKSLETPNAIANISDATANASVDAKSAANDAGTNKSGRKSGKKGKRGKNKTK